MKSTADSHPVVDYVDADPLDVLQTLALWQQEGQATVLATVIETWGSSPRPVGSVMGMNARGDVTGSVSAGCVEGEVLRQAQRLMAQEKPARTCLEFGVADEMAWDVGLACGGRIRILLDPIVTSRAAVS
ncbi:MAG: XdhC family protein [Pseudomonadota bacterium]